MKNIITFALVLYFFTLKNSVMKKISNLLSVICWLCFFGMFIFVMNDISLNENTNIEVYYQYGIGQKMLLSASACLIILIVCFLIKLFIQNKISSKNKPQKF